MAFAFNIGGFIQGFVDQGNKIKEQNQKDSALDIQKAAQGDKHALNQAHINYYNALTNAKGNGAVSAKDQSAIDIRNARIAVLKQQAAGTYNPTGKTPGAPKGAIPLDDAPNPAAAARGGASGPGPAVGSGSTPGMGGVTRPFPAGTQAEASDEDIATAQDAADDEDDDNEDGTND
jgi:hypothetical protein